MNTVVRNAASDAVHFLNSMLRHLGPRAVARLPLDMWPLWDTNLAVVGYRDGAPIAQSMAMAHVTGATGRTDLWRVPEIGADVAPLDPDLPIRWGSAGRWSVLFYGELPKPVEFTPPGDDMDLYPSGVIDGTLAVKAGLQAVWGAALRGVHVFPDGSTCTPPDLSRALGFSGSDTTWVPDRWLDRVGFGQIDFGHDEVVTGDGEPVWLAWQRIRCSAHHVYWVRLVLP